MPRIAAAIAIIVTVTISSGYAIWQVYPLTSDEPIFSPNFISILNPIKPDESMFITVNLEAHGSIAAQRDITVYSRLAPNHESRIAEGTGYSDLPNSYLLVFRGSFCPQGTMDKYDSQNTCSIPLSKVPVKNQRDSPGGFNYEGTGIIQYSTGGRFGVLLGTNFDQALGTANATVTNEPFINIISAEDALQAEFSRKAILLAIPLAVIGSAISLVALLRK